VASPAELEQHYQRILDERMQGLAFLNPRLQVEAVGFRDMDEHQAGVLITPWFMNLIVLPGNADWDELTPGSLCQLELPAGRMEFNAGGDDAIGRLLTAVLFTTVTDFPDHGTARDVAVEIMDRLFLDPVEAAQQTAPRMSRRALLSATGRD
jgi:[NiFe] hydrogenase assembly HybE family chaperone